MSQLPNPGSDEAREQGCTCPVLDNHHGHGFQLNGETVFWLNEACQLHKRNNRKDAHETNKATATSGVRD